MTKFNQYINKFGGAVSKFGGFLSSHPKTTNAGIQFITKQDLPSAINLYKEYSSEISKEPEQSFTDLYNKYY